MRKPATTVEDWNSIKTLAVENCYYYYCSSHLHRTRLKRSDECSAHIVKLDLSLSISCFAYFWELLGFIHNSYLSCFSYYLEMFERPMHYVRGSKRAGLDCAASFHAQILLLTNFVSLRRQVTAFRWLLMGTASKVLWLWPGSGTAKVPSMLTAMYCCSNDACLREFETTF